MHVYANICQTNNHYYAICRIIISCFYVALNLSTTTTSDLSATPTKMDINVTTTSFMSATMTLDMPAISTSVMSTTITSVVYTTATPVMSTTVMSSMLFNYTLSNLLAS